MSDTINNSATNDCNGDELNKSPLQSSIEAREREWLVRVKSLNEKMRNLADIRDLMPELYTQRQICLEYYNNVLRMLSKQQHDYKPKYAQRYNYYKMNSQIRYTSDTAIISQVQSDLSDDIMNIELMNNHAKYIQETIKTIDAIIYGISNRLQLEKIIKGYDF